MHVSLRMRVVLDLIVIRGAAIFVHVVTPRRRTKEPLS